MVKFLISRPIAVLMTTLGILILGFYASSFIPISLMPDVDIPQITIQVEEANMSARQLEDGIISNFRDQLRQVTHLADITSETSNGISIINLYFNHGTKIDYAYIEVNEKIDRLMGYLPKSIKRPKVIKASITDIPVFYVSLTLKNEKKRRVAKNKNFYPVSQEFVDFTRFANQVIKKRIEQVPEVAMVDISGIVTSEILIIPNVDKLLSLKLDLNDIESVIKSNNVSVENLTIKDYQYEYNIRLGNDIKTIKELKNLYVKKGSRIFQLKELAQIIEHPKKRKGLVLSEGKEAVTMAVIKQHDARIGNLKENLNTLLENLHKDYKNINFKVTRNQTKLLDYAISNLLQSLLWGIILSFLIMFLFFRSIKTPILIAIVVPISMVICILFFQLFKISINIISLSGLVLGIGLMIDNSIIVIDNITQYREQNYTLVKACVLGTNEVFKPLLSSALTTCAIFIPLIFISGISGALFFDQAMAISIGLFVSLLVSLTLLPVLFYLFNKNNKSKKGKISLFLEKINKVNYELIYEKGFRWVMRKQKISWLIIFLLLVCSILLYIKLPKAKMPELSKTEILLKIDWNQSISIQDNKERILKLINEVKDNLNENTALVGGQQFILDKQALAKTSETTFYFSCKSTIRLKETINKINGYLNNNYSEALYIYKEVDNIFTLIFSDNKPPLVAKLRNVSRLSDLKNNQLKEMWYQVQETLEESLKLKPIVWQESMILIVNKEKLMVYNVDEQKLVNGLKSAFGERVIFQISDNNSFVPVVLGAKQKSIQEILNETFVISKDSALINVKEFLHTSQIKNLKSIIGGKQGEYYPINLEIDDKDIKKVQKNIEKIVRKNKWYEVDFSGSFFENKELINELIFVLLISLILLYFILASQFESFLLPIIILMEVPIDIAGALLLLKIFSMSINLMSLIGIVVMSGIIINDSILKIDTIVQLQKQGYSLIKSLLVAGQRRLKPIMMTSLTTILALIPLLFYSGLGSELQAPLSVSLIGGMLLGTFISLYFIPLCYYYFAKYESRK
jgi:multidrug efflux pump subunit AcrB